MKKIKIAYWIVTILFALLMLSNAIPNLLATEEWVKLMKDFGYPVYLLPFLGVAKILAVAVILIPGFPRLKEWAYAGLAYDLVGVTYSGLAMGTPVFYMLPMLMFIVPGAASYILYRIKQKKENEVSAITN